MKKLFACLSLFALSIVIADGPTGVLVSSTLALKEFVTETLGGE